MVDVLFSFLCVLISIRCLGCSFKEIFRTLKDFLLLLVIVVLGVIIIIFVYQERRHYSLLKQYEQLKSAMVT